MALAKHIHADHNLLNAFTLNLLTKDEVIAVNQDAFGKQATCVQTIGDLRIYVKEMEGGSRVARLLQFWYGEGGYLLQGDSPSYLDTPGPLTTLLRNSKQSIP